MGLLPPLVESLHFSYRVLRLDMINVCTNDIDLVHTSRAVTIEPLEPWLYGYAGTGEMNLVDDVFASNSCVRYLAAGSGSVGGSRRRMINPAH